jgi:hypothetical protein
VRLLPIVEGDGDMAAVPELVRRIAHAHQRFDVGVNRPHKRGDLPKVLGRFDDYLRTALLEGAPVLWVLDYDCAQCTNAAKHKHDLERRASKVAGSTPVEFVFMVKEFETLFLADEATTRKAFPDIPAATAFPGNPEAVRDAKGWLSSARPKGLAYKATSHQMKLAAQVNLGTLRTKSKSFVRFEESVLKLLASA